jgi:hypothetical protein
MNYAEDRLDRKARGTDLWEDFRVALCQNDHVLLGRTLRDAGWIRHAVFHYSHGVQQGNVGDYAQMAELAGFPEIGVLALLHYRNRGIVKTFDDCKLDLSAAADDPLWLQQEAPEGHCGCGLDECGQSLCEIPMIGLEPVLEALQSYIQGLSYRAMPTAHEVLTATAKNERLSCSDDIHELLQFWKTDSIEYRSLSPVLQLLLLKQLYLVLPTLAAEAVLLLQVDQRKMAIDFKSHNAYHVLIQAVVLGERIKPYRRRTMPDYHVPVWDILWGHDGRHGQVNLWSPAADLVQHFQKCLEVCQRNEYVPKLFISTNRRPLYVVGDSHVLSTAWQTIRLSDGEYLTLVPVTVTGLKAWHCRPETRFFTHSLLKVLLQRLLPTDCILFSAGEIDCREGLGGPQLEGYATIDEQHVRRTVLAFVNALTLLQPTVTIWVLPVCPHVHRSDRNGKAVGRAARRQVTQMWNEQLRRALPCGNIKLLDYEKSLLGDSGYVLKQAYNADGTHMNSAFLRCLENAMGGSDPYDTNASTLNIGYCLESVAEF